MGEQWKDWHVAQTVELGASAKEVWDLIGGFYTIHKWHPDIHKSEVPPQQTETSAVRRVLTFPGQPTTTEELVMMDNENFHYTYRWHAGEWGENVKKYKASIQVFEIDDGRRCIVQWASTFYYFEDALHEFYWNGFRELQKRFPLPAS
jgi:polyketide cyclase/dehydrase/lipid transport protein